MSVSDIPFHLVIHKCQLTKRYETQETPMKRKIIGFHQDELGDWVADLECGHTQHVRHNPPWTNRPWVISNEGRQRFLGFELNCKDCDHESEQTTQKEFKKKPPDSTNI